MTGSQSSLLQAGAAAEMGDLDHHRRALFVDVVRQLLEPRHAFVLVEKDVAERLRTVGRDHRRAADHGERDASLRLFGVVEAIALFGHAVLGIGRLVRRRHQPVAQREAAQLKRLQQRIAGHGPASDASGELSGARAARSIATGGLARPREGRQQRRSSIGWSKVDWRSWDVESEGQGASVGRTERTAWPCFRRSGRAAYRPSARERGALACAAAVSLGIGLIALAGRDAPLGGEPFAVAKVEVLPAPPKPAPPAVSARAHEPIAPPIASAAQVEAASGVEVTRGSAGRAQGAYHRRGASARRRSRFRARSAPR